ncbi:MAG: AAA family ATPase, partial [Nitriliruptorales bacterium]
MFLKSVTMRGFKSFADRTTLEFEPGITVIVGPNGSGKSNVVDALAWVLGTRSPKLLRGGELADVIFAGSPSRNAVGSALVEITIDNSHGQLGLDGLGAAGSAKGFSEVTLSREILTTGESVYAINGEECRLLDIQELLSDTGLGRELHTIVGQGHLDDSLQAKPEDRRAFVEEAAGILKHRRRRERAERKLAQVDVHVERLRTVIRELRRQLRPLERQAEAANEHERLQAELREVRIGLAARDLAQLQGVWERESGDDEQLAARQLVIEEAVSERDAVVAALEERLREGAPAIEAARDAGESLARLRERLRGTADLIEARRRHLIEYVEEPLAGRAPDALRAQAARLDEDCAELEGELAELRAELDAAAAASQAAQDAAQEHDRR